MQSSTVISSVPYKVKAEAIRLMLENGLTNRVPATMLKEHPDVTVYLDTDSASAVDKKLLEKYL